jgi:outer membrane lipoprotein-sorting protein
MRRTVLVILAIIAATPAWTLTGAEIIQRVRDRGGTPTTQARIKMVIQEKDGTPAERLLDQYSLNPTGSRKSIIIFQKPASVQRTRFLTIENKGRDDDRWIYLPALGRVRRIAGTEGSSSFMGSHFSYDDLSSRDVERDEHTVLREETLGDAECYVIETKPGKAGDWQYARAVSWIGKETFVLMKAEMYNDNDRLIKRLTASNIEKVDGVWTARALRMEDLLKDGFTTLEFTIVQHGKPIPAGVFTTKFLETGTP